jgi:uncharacterized membrane protein YkoI
MVKKGISIVTVFLLFFCGSAFAKPYERRLIYMKNIAAIDLAMASKRVAERMKGRVYFAELDRIPHRSFEYEIYANIDGKAVEIAIDPRTGQIKNATDIGFWERWTDNEEIKAVEKAGITMDQAIESAQELCEGKAMKAEIDVLNNQVIYLIEVENEFGRCEAMIDSQNGESFKIRQKHIKHFR